MKHSRPPGMTFTRIAASAAFFCLAVTGCYTQKPLESVVPSPDTRIIARVTDSGAVAIGGPVGPGALEVEGIVATADQAVWQLSLTRVSYRGGSSVLWNREVVSFPRNALTNVSVKRMSKSRSWMAAGLIAAGAILASQMFGELGGGEPGGDGGGIPQQ